MTSQSGDRADSARADSCAYFVNNRPQVSWAWDLKDRNLNFLRAIDPGYYVHIRKHEAPILEEAGLDAQYAAASIRLAHAQAVETLFALLGALAQAPYCPIGWMLAYSNPELREVTKALISIQGLVDKSAWEEGVTLGKLANLVFSRTGWLEEKVASTAESFARMWQHWASSMLDMHQVAEYNSFKHGSRVALGGHAIRIGRETTPGLAVPSEGMVTMGGSVFGTSFYTSVELGGRLHQYPQQRSHNWSATALVDGLDLLAMSIRNVIACLRIIGGDDPGECEFQIPEDPAAYNLPFAPVRGVTLSSFDLKLGVENIEPLTKDQVLHRLRP
ncbi:conserved hypothetical protein [Arthrobacter sp. Hiyo8]|uniref:hypothetical protein n=1 Tax=Arthrobacter sp. Hiyo1 TaxID=1588020 RepID=UPI000683A44A|nr:hypothetical protein [Arthrobacter sp. Hiyo1]BAS12075.1 conserved hypothetical protein [Arthrobacter sp. Hiyo8]GAP61216.1 conserved hypothetical protein [Arthrobacter sp. Hiyo1]